MRKWTWMLAIALSTTALTFTACTDDKGENDDDLIIIEDDSYALTCNGESICDLKMDAGKSANIILQLSKKDSQGMMFLVGDSTLKFQTDSTLFKMQSSDDKELEIQTSELGQVNLRVTAGDEKGSGSIKVEAPAELEASAVEINILIEKAEDEIVLEDLEGKISVQYTYAGANDIAAADAIIFANANCSELAPTGLNGSQVAAISSKVGALSSNLTTLGDGQNLSDLVVTIDTKAKEGTLFAVVGRTVTDGHFQAYGCVNAIAYDGNTTIALNDVYAGEVVEPDPDPDPELTIYSGEYQLVSSFDALSILPKADTTGTPLFTEMLLGDWIAWSLDFLSDPETALPEILTKQILPLLLNADWFKDLIEKVSPGLASILTPEVIDILLEQVGAKQLITDLLNQLTGQVTWWDNATSTIEVINQIAQNFTLVGQFNNRTHHLNEQNAIAGIGHNYNTLWFHNGGFDSCLIGSQVKIDKNGKLICAIPLKSIEDNNGETIRGAFSMTLVETEEGDYANIAPHALEMAYGKLIYGVIMEFLPLITGLTDESAPKTISGVLVYYIGQGLVSSWNKQDELEDKDKINAELHSCAGVGAALSKYLGSRTKDKGIAGIITTFANPATLAGLCETGVTALDGLIDKQIDKLAVTSNAVTFESKQCPLYYSEDALKLDSFGKAQIGWEDSSSNRCTWNMSVTVKDEVQKVTGKYSAVRILK